MATETEQVTQEIKEALEGFKAIGQYAKDLASAIASADQPLQRANDMTKAIEVQMETIAENSRGMVESVKKMTDSVGATISKMRELNQVQSEAKTRLTEAREELVRQQVETETLRTKKAQTQLEEREAWTRLRNEQSKSHEAAESTRGIWSRTIDSVKELQVEIAKAGYETDKFGVTSKKAGLKAGMARFTAGAMSSAAELFTGQADPAGAVRSIGAAVASLGQTAGIGGLVGMMIYGKIKDAEFRAVGETAGQMFDQISGHTSGFAARMGGVARSLSVYAMAAKEDLAQVAAAFAATGVNAATAQIKIDGFVSSVGNDLIIATLAADKALELPAGTFAKLSGTIARDFNTSADKAFINLMNLATAAKEAGMNAATFLQQTMEVSSSLRLMNANAGAAGATMLGLSKTMQGRGMGAAYAQAYTGAGMGSVASATAGLGEGLSAIIGERLGYSSGLEALYAMKTGSGQSARGSQQLDLAAVMKEMRNIVTGDMALTNRSEQAFALQKLFGVDVTGADAIIDAMEEANKTGKLSAKSQDELNRAFQSESAKTNQIMKLIDVIKDAISNVMVGLLGMIVSGLKMLLNGVMYLTSQLMTSTLLNTDARSREEWSEAARRYNANIESGVLISGKATDRILKGLNQGSGAMGGLIREFDLAGGWPWSKGRYPSSTGDSGSGQGELGDPTVYPAAHITKTRYSKNVPQVGRVEVETKSSVHVVRPDRGTKRYDSGAY